MARDIRVALELDNSKFNRNLQQSEKQVDQFTTSSTAGVKRLGVAFAALGGAALVKNIFDVGQSFQSLQVSLNFVTGSAEAGADAFNNLTTLATQTQFGVEELVQTFIRLKGAGIEPTNDLLLTFADTASLAQDQLGVLTALTELFARGATKGKLELEDFNKIAERGVDVFRPLTKEFGMSIEEIQKLAKTAEGQEQLFRGIQKALDDTYGGALVEKLATSEVAFSNLAIAARRLADALFKGLGLDSTTAIDSLTDAVNKLADNIEPVLKFAKGLAQLASVFLFFIPAAKGLKAASFAMTKLKGSASLLAASGPKLGAFLKNTGGGILKGITSPIKTATAALGRLMSRNGKWVESTSIATKKISKVWRGDILSPFGRAILIFRKVGEGLAWLGGATLGVLGLKNAIEGANSVAEGFAEKMGPPRKLFDDEQLKQYMELTDNDTLFDTKIEPPKGTEKTLTKLQQFAKEIDDSKGGLEEYKRLMALLNETFSDPETIAAMEEKASAIADLNSSYSSLFDPLKDLNDAISDGVEDSAEQVRLQAELNRLQELGIYTTNELTEAQRNLDKAFNENTGLLAFISTLNTATDTLADDLAVSLMEGKSVLDDFKNFFKTLVKQLIADAIKMLFIIPILQAVGFSVGPTGSIAGLSGSGLLGKLGFKATGAGGGAVMANRPMLIGEQGMEIFTPSSSGTITPNSQMGTNVYYTINATDPASFQAQLSRDPQFVHAIVQKGQNSMPSGRRF
jgi:tape measure domain-containing protein